MICEKIAYETFRKAMEAAVLLKKRKKGKHQYRPYKCTFCNCFHLTTITKRLFMPRKINKYPIRFTLPSKQKKGKKQKGRGHRYPKSDR